MTAPKISVIATAIHTEFWEQLLSDLNVQNTTTFEVVFVGNVRSAFPFPSYFTHIYSEAKPAQCLETACRNARGEYVMIVADDHLPPPKMLDTMYSYAIRMRDDKAVVMARYADSVEGPVCDNLLSFYLNDPRSPVVGVNTVFKRSVWKDLGGLDKRFTSIKSDLDMQMRFYEAGGHPFIVPNCLVRERPHANRSRLISTSGDQDGKLLYSLWVKDNRVCDKRLDTVQPFEFLEAPIVR